MALVLDPRTGQLVDDGTGAGFGAAAASRERVQAPLVSAAPAGSAADPQMAAAIAQRDQRRANNAVLEQDRANLRAANLAPMVGPQPETSMAGSTLAGVNQRIQQALDSSRAPAPIPGERGNYNLANTSTVDRGGNISSTLRQPDNIVEGGYGGFGGGRAQAYLSQFAAPRRERVMSASEQLHLENQLTSDNPFERRAARDILGSRQALQLDAGATQRTGMQVAGEQARAQTAGLAALQAAQVGAAGREAAAQTSAQSRVEAAQANALGRLGAAQLTADSGANTLARVRAEQEARRLAVAQAAEEAGDLAARDRALGISQPAAPRLTVDPLGRVVAADGRPVTQAEAEAFRRASSYYDVPVE